MPQPDNSRFVHIRKTAQGPVAILVTEGGNGEQSEKAFDLLDINKILENIEKNIKKSRSAKTKEFHETEKTTFTSALDALREAKKVPVPGGII